MKRNVKKKLLSLLVCATVLNVSLDWSSMEIYAAQKESIQSEENDVRENSWRYSEGEPVYRNEISRNADLFLCF